MSVTCNYGCATLPNHQQVVCGDFPLGGISSAAFLECNHGITDFSNPSQWQSAISAELAKLILEVKAEIPAASPNMQDNPVGRGSEQIIAGFDNTVTITDKNVSAANDDFYARLNKRKGYLVVYNYENDEIYVSSQPVDFQAIPRTVPLSNKEIQSYTITATFYTKVGEVPMQAYAAPAGIFS